MSKTNRMLKVIAYILIGVLLIITLIHYHIAENTEEGTESRKSVMGLYKEATEDGFIMLYNKKEIKVIAQNAPTAPMLGEVLVHGYLDKDTIVATNIHTYDYNYVLYALSAIAGLIVMRQFFREWKITKRGIINA